MITDRGPERWSTHIKDGGRVKNQGTGKARDEMVKEATLQVS